MQGVLVAPVSRAVIVLGKILGGTTLAALQGLFFLALVPTAGISPSLAGVFLTVFLVLLTSFAMTGLGLVVAWPMESTQGFHSVMNLFLIPMWLLSGALFPSEGAASAIRWIMRLNPLSYSIDGLRSSIYWTGQSSWRELALPVLVTGSFGLVTFVVTVFIASQKERGSR